MTRQKSPLSTTAHTRILAALPSKAYLAMHLILGGDTEARAKLNELARALMLNYFYDKMKGHLFMTESDTEALDAMCELPQFDLEEEDWAKLQELFKARGEGDPDSPAYVVNSVADLLSRPALDDALVS
jgi:hypothetical protein